MIFIIRIRNVMRNAFQENGTDYIMSSVAMFSISYERIVRCGNFIPLLLKYNSSFHYYHNTTIYNLLII
jgi:hypothetical protein